MKKKRIMARLNGIQKVAAKWPSNSLLDFEDKVP